LIRHVADLELLSAKNFFGCELEVMPKTLIAERDTGEWTDLNQLLSYQKEAHDILEGIFECLTEAEWSKPEESEVFGTKSKAEFLGRIISHTAYHVGQLGLTLKYGAISGSEVTPGKLLGPIWQAKSVDKNINTSIFVIVLNTNI
jgi:hypothetical protein